MNDPILFMVLTVFLAWHFFRINLQLNKIEEKLKSINVNRDKL